MTFLLMYVHTEKIFQEEKITYRIICHDIIPYIGNILPYPIKEKNELLFLMLSE